MDFTLGETQHAVARLAGEVLRREVDHGRAGAVTPEAGYDDALWKAMAGAGLLALAAPEDLGGDGLGVLETAAVLAEVGRHAAAVPALATLALGVLPLARLGTARQRAELLPGAISGATVLTAATRELSAPMSAVAATVARRDGAGYVVSGVQVGVPYATVARRILVPATLEGGRAGGDSGVLLIDPTATGVTTVPAPTSSGAPAGRVLLDQVRADGADLLGGDDSGAAVAELRRLAVVGVCVLVDGLLDGALARTAHHVRTREQFGRPLAAFQAVAQQVADVYVAVRTLHLAAWSGCWRLANALDADEDLDVAAYWVAEEAPEAVRTCHHLHGGLGLDVTYPLHRHYAQVKDLVHLLGGREATLDRLAARDAGCA